MNPDLAALLAGIRDDPDDDLPRRALADWCLEQPDRPTQARGEYIQLALQRAAMKDAVAGLDEHIDELERQYRRHWLGSLLQKTHRLGIDRGMLVAEVSPGTLWRASWETLASRDAWPWVLTLIGRSFNAKAVTTLAQAEAGTTLARMELPYSQPGEEGMRALAESARLAGLRALDLRTSPVGDAVFPLAHSAALAGLTRLGLFDTNLTPAGVAALASGSLSWLRTLNLGNNRIEDEGARALAGSANVANLNKLWLHNTEIGDEGVLALARAPHLARLRVLDLSRNRIGLDGVVALTGCPRLSGLEELNLSHNPLDDRAGELLARSPYLENLRTLWLDDVSISESDVRALISSPTLPRLETLHVSGAHLSLETWLELSRRERPRVIASPF